MTQHIRTEDLQSFTKGLERKQALPNCLYLIIQVLFYSLLYHTLSLCVHIMHKLIQCKDPISLKRMLRLEVLSGPSPLFWTYFIRHSLKELLLLLLLLLSRFSRVRLCATPQTVAHQAPPSLGFSRQEHWSGLPFPSPMHEVKSESQVAQLCLTLSDPMDYSLPGSSIHGIFQTRVLEWGAIVFTERAVS